VCVCACACARARVRVCLCARTRVCVDHISPASGGTRSGRSPDPGLTDQSAGESTSYN